MQVMKVALFKHNMPEYVEAVDYCFMLFECLTIGALAFVMFYTLVDNIGMYAMLMTIAVSVIYKVYYTFKYTKAKNIFKRKK